MKNQDDQNKNKRILVTGAAGFIGFYFTKRLLAEGFQVIGIDNLNNYYTPKLKTGRLQELGFNPEELENLGELSDNTTVSPICLENVTFYHADLKSREAVNQIFEKEKPGIVVHLAAQAGVRYSLENPYAYLDSNLVGFMNILENCRQNKVHHLLFASSSSVYGANEKTPFSENDQVNHPVSLYAATKKSNELMAHSYAHLYRIPVTGLRFFTVYGPWGRPDMAYFSFTRKILANEPIEVFNHGDMKRDFTYIDDIVEGVYRVMLKTPQSNEKWNALCPEPATSSAPYRIFNIGNNQPVELLYFIELLEKNLGKKAEKKLMPFQKGDVKETYADIDTLQEYVGFKPSTPIETGIARFVEWYLAHKF